MTISGCAAASLQWLDERRRSQHCFLETADRCCYLWEYRPGRARDAAQRWIRDLKCSPLLAAVHLPAARKKERALLHAAQALRAAAPRAWVERTSWCPIPPSARIGGPDYDDRLLRLLHMAFERYDADIRPLLRQSQSLPADHRERRRVSVSTLYGLLSVDTGQLGTRMLRPEVVLFDDVLTTGKHFKCAQARLRERLGPISISACVLARRVLSPRRCGLAGAAV